MYRFIKSSLMVCLLACASLAVSFPAFAGGMEEDMPEETSAEETLIEEAVLEKAPVIKDTDVSVYGRFWPRLTYKDNGGSSTDITDALSRVGVKADTQITDTLSAVLHGEWDVDIEANGDFGDARLAYVGIKSSELGLLAIGKQWDPHFNITAEVTDIFYHRASPFGYDNAGPFRNNNLVRYAHSIGGISLDAGMQVNGSPENGAGDDHIIFRTNSDVSSDSDNVDAFSIGASARGESLYLGVSYLRQNKDDAGLERNFLGVGASVSAIENFYLGVTYQYLIDNHDSGEEKNPYTLDVAASYSFGDGMKALAGFFAYDDDRDTESSKLFGYTVTLIKEIHSSTDIFVEWVLTDYDQKDSVNTFSLGFRYDFNVAIF